MSGNEPKISDEGLSKILSEWRIDFSLPAGFQNEVWRRIARAQPVHPSDSSIWGVLTDWLATRLPRPMFASTYVGILLAIGIGAGWTQGRQDNARVKDELGRRYVHVLDPYVTPRP